MSCSPANRCRPRHLSFCRLHSKLQSSNLITNQSTFSGSLLMSLLTTRDQIFNLITHGHLLQFAISRVHIQLIWQVPVCRFDLSRSDLADYVRRGRLSDIRISYNLQWLTTKPTTSLLSIVQLSTNVMTDVKMQAVKTVKDIGIHIHCTSHTIHSIVPRRHLR